MTPFSTKRAACLHCDFRHKDIFNFHVLHLHEQFHFFRCYYIITKKILSRHFTLRHYMLHHFMLRHCMRLGFNVQGNKNACNQSFYKVDRQHCLEKFTELWEANFAEALFFSTIFLKQQMKYFLTFCSQQ